MSSSSAPFRVRTPRVPAGIELLDARRRTVVSGVGEIDTEVPLGLYRLRVSTGAHAEETIITVDEGGYQNLELSTRVLSAAPIFGTRAQHEFHAYGVRDLLRAGPVHSFGRGGGVVVFARNLVADDQDDYTPRLHGHVPVEQLSLWQLRADAPQDSSMVTRCDVGSRSRDQGWAGCFLEVEPGPYVLRWDRPRARASGLWRNPNRIVDQALFVSPGWITFVFVGNRPDTGLMRSNASIHMGRFHDDARVDAWSVSASASLANEVVLAGLRRGEVLVGRETIDLLVHSKFGNPMLGVLGAHALLSSSELRIGLLGKVLGNLEDLLGIEHPDYQALCVRAHGRGFDAVSLGEVRAPPMLHVSYRSLIESDPLHPGVLVDDSAAELIAPRLRSETPWTTWTPFEERHAEKVEALQVERAARISVSAYLPTRRLDGPVLRGLARPLRDALASPEVGRVTQWLDYARDNAIDPDQLGAVEIATRVGLPVATTRRALRWLRAAADEAQTEPDERPPAVPRQTHLSPPAVVAVDRVGRVLAHDGIVAILVQSPERSADPVWVGDDTWRDVVRAAVDVHAVADEPSVRALVGGHVVLISGEDERVVGIVFVKGHRIVKSIVRMVRQLLKEGNSTL